MPMTLVLGEAWLGYIIAAFLGRQVIRAVVAPVLRAKMSDVTHQHIGKVEFKRLVEIVPDVVAIYNRQKSDEAHRCRS